MTIFSLSGNNRAIFRTSTKEWRTTPIGEIHFVGRGLTVADFVEKGVDGSYYVDVDKRGALLRVNVTAYFTHPLFVPCSSASSLHS